MVRNDSVHEPVSTSRGSKRWTLSSVRWVASMMNTSMNAAMDEMLKNVTIYHCDRSLGMWCLIKSSMAAANDRNIWAHVALMCMMDVRSLNCITIRFAIVYK